MGNFLCISPVCFAYSPVGCTFPMTLTGPLLQPPVGRKKTATESSTSAGPPMYIYFHECNYNSKRKNVSHPMKYNYANCLIQYCTLMWLSPLH